MYYRSQLSRMKIDHPYSSLPEKSGWLRGNLHTHTTKSDGAREPQEVISDYAERGYDFLMISDHDIYTSPEHYKQWDAKGMVLIPGNEISRDGVHILHVDADRRIEPFGQRQRVIQSVNETQGFTIVAHPNWRARFNHCSIEQLEEWVGYTGLEIYNGTVGRLDGSPYATNKWDMLLAAERKIWGFANDDSHLAVDDVALGWNVVMAEERSPSGIVTALRSGRFYASTGVTISSIEVDGTKIRLETEDACRIVALTRLGTRRKVVDDRVIEFEVAEKMSYVRFECWGKGESFAWTQPFFVVEE